MAGGMRAGAAMVDVTPEAGAHLAGSGMGEHRPAQTVLDRLYAKALVLESGGRRLALVVVDATIIAEEFTRAVREGAKRSLGLDADCVMVHATQTHSAPGVGRFMLDPEFPLDAPPDKDYLWGSEASVVERYMAGALRALEQADRALRPVQAGMASGIRADLAFNRRAVTRENRAAMPWPAGWQREPLGPTHIRHMEGPIDPEVGVLSLRGPDMQPVALLLHYTCHPVNVFATSALYHAVSADWPGTWCDGMRPALGEHGIPMVVNGCCGNVNPWDPFDPGYVPDHVRMGRELARTALKVAASVRHRDSDVLDCRRVIVPLAYREVPADRLQAVERILSESRGPRWLPGDSDRIDPQWFHAASTRSIDICRRRWPEFPYEVQVFRIGDAAVVGLPGEPFTESQLAVKLASPTPHTIVAHMVSHYVGYLPPREAYARGGHEANFECTYWAKFAPGSAERVVEAAGKALAELFPQRVQ